MKKGLTSHFYRVLHLRRRPVKKRRKEIKYWKKRERNTSLERKTGKSVSTKASLSRTTLVKRTQGIIWATGQTVMLEAKSASITSRNPLASEFCEHEAKIKDSEKGESLEKRTGSKGVARIKRIVKELGRSQHLLKSHIRKCPTNERRRTPRVNQVWEVGSINSTQRVGEPLTGGRN